MNAQELAAEIVRRARDKSRLITAIAGPPGSGKSTLAAEVVESLHSMGENAALLPMDGFHFDNAVLDQRGLLPRKGAPETFDSFGFFRSLRAIRTGNRPIAVPVFDRELDLARAGARIIVPENRLIVAEGNYLLLNTDPWTDLAPLFDLTVFLAVADDELETRLIQRWLDHGHNQKAAETRARENDMVNARLVKEGSRRADIVIHD
ncbi:MAG: nucleoside triphosphate hydrolase [Rhizobiaceae bacterium]